MLRGPGRVPLGPPDAAAADRGQTVFGSEQMRRLYYRAEGFGDLLAGGWRPGGRVPGKRATDGRRASPGLGGVYCNYGIGGDGR